MAIVAKRPLRRSVCPWSIGRGGIQGNVIGVWCLYRQAPDCAGSFGGGTTDLATIAVWWERRKHASVGISMGHGIWCLDIDYRHGGDKTLRDLEKTYGLLPDTVQSLTGSGDGSMHKIWLEPTTNCIPNITLGKGLDVLGLGKGIIAPASIHAKKKENRYEWQRGTLLWTWTHNPLQSRFLPL